MQKDGHTHTEFCPHGSGDDVELMIQKAIKFGFTDYSITDHAPLPPAFINDYDGTPAGFTTASMALPDVEPYLAKCRAMQAKYADQINIRFGFELDFLPSQIEWTREFWAKYGPQTSDNILSIHFLEGTNGKFWCVDNTVDEFAGGLLGLGARDPQDIYAAYLEALKVAVTTDLGPNAPHRLGHLTLIKKFQDYFDLPLQFDAANMNRVDELLVLLKTGGWELDLNVSGLFKEYCNEIYPTNRIAQMARARGIKLCYGSDAHDIKSVGHAYHQVASLLN